MQTAIESIEQNADFGSQKLTILIIAHRLTSIRSAKNLLFIERRDKICGYRKGTAAYEEVFVKLQNITYQCGEGDEEEKEERSILSRSSVMQRSSMKLRNSTMQHFEEIEEVEDWKKTQVKRVMSNETKPSMTGKAGDDVRTSLKQRALSHESIEDLDLDNVPGYRNINGAEIMAFYKPTWLAVVGIIASCVCSVQLPIFGFFLSKMVFVLMLPIDNPEFVQQRDFWVLMFGILCFGMFLFTFIQKLAFGYGSENLVKTIRVKLFEAILYKHIGWFDNKERAPGVLGNVIQEDIAQLNGLTSETYAVALESILGLLVSSGMCLYFSWQVGIIAIILSPMMVFGGFFMSSFQWSQGKVDDAYQESNALLSDIIMNYRTIISLGDKNVEFILGRYYKLLEEPNRQGIKRAHFSGMLFGYSQSVRFVFVALSFYFATLIIEKFELTGKAKNDVFTAVYIMFVGAIGAGVSVS